MRSVCGTAPARLVRLTEGGLNETYRAELRDETPIVVRIARHPEGWFTDEAHLMAKARAAGVPTPDVLGVEQVDHEGERLSFSIQRLLPGRPLREIARELAPADLERLIVNGGELLARVHGANASRGMKHELEPPDEDFVTRVVGVADQAMGPDAAGVVERGAGLLRDAAARRPAPGLALAHGDWLPKHLLIDAGEIAGVIDWEFAGPAPPAFDLAHWEVAAGEGLYDHWRWLRRGYARVADPDVADGGWVPAFAIFFALDVLGWRNPAPPGRLRRCVEVIRRYVDGRP